SAHGHNLRLLPASAEFRQRPKVSVWATACDDCSPVFEKPTKSDFIGFSAKLATHKKCLCLSIHSELGMHIESKLEWRCARPSRSNDKHRFDLRNRAQRNRP